MDLEFKEILTLLKKRAWVLLFTIVLFFILGFIISTFIISPIYQSDVKFIAHENKQQQNSSTTISDIEVNSKLGDTYSQMVKSRDILESVIKQLKLDISYNELYKNIQVENINETGIIQLSVKGKNPNEVYQIAKEIPNILNKEIKKIFTSQSILVIENADIVKKPISPNKVLINFISSVMGGFVGLTSIFYYEYLDKKIRFKNNKKSIEGIYVIGKIPYIKNNNNPPINSNDEKIYHNIIKNIEFSNIDKNIKIILITSFKSKEGKTLIISNLAVELSKLGKKTLLIDLNLINPTIDKKLKIQNTKYLSNYLINSKSIKECIVKDYVKNMDLLLTEEISSKTSKVLNSSLIKNIFNELKNEYDYILIDTPAMDVCEDASIISSYIDSAIIVCENKKVKTSELLEIKDKLQIEESNIIGIVFNKVKSLRDIN